MDCLEKKQLEKKFLKHIVMFYLIMLIVLLGCHIVEVDSSIAFALNATLFLFVFQSELARVARGFKAASWPERISVSVFILGIAGGCFIFLIVLLET